MKPYDNQHALELTEEERLQEWDEVEALVMTYQKFLHDPIDGWISKEAANILLDKFSPLFKSYLTVIKYNQIDWNNMEQKQFVAQFIGDKSLKRALGRKKTAGEFKAKIYQRFNFIVSTYGTLNEEDILEDLYMCFLTLMKRYKQTGKNFCAYVANSFHYEVSRHIKKQTSNPLAVNYKNYVYEDTINGEDMHEFYEDNYYELSTGLPDYTWINGETCSDMFLGLSNLQRKILIEYYLEDCNDKQISSHTATNIGTINSKRRDAVYKLSEELGIGKEEIPRKRKSGKPLTATKKSRK